MSIKQCNECKQRMLAAGAMITQYICPHCLELRMSSSTYHPRLCLECSKRLNRCQRCCKVIIYNDK